MTPTPLWHKATSLCFRTYAIVCVLLISLCSFPAYAQFPDGCVLNCTANDVEEIIAFLGYSDTTMLVDECDVGNPVDDVIIWIQITFNSNASREPIRWVGDIVTSPPDGDPVITEFAGCINDNSTAGETVILLAADTISWTCGDEILIQNFLAGWAQPGGGQECDDCPNNSKCLALPDIYVQAPLVANFIVMQTCVPGGVYETITYVDRTIGGVEPYTYSWTFDGDASSASSSSDSVEIQYSSTGMKSASLIVVDADGDSSTFSMDTIQVDLCCQLTVVCPADKIYACLEDVPDLPTSFDDNIQGSDSSDFNTIDELSEVISSCGDLIITASESDNGGGGCVGDTLVITRTLTIYDDVNDNNVLDQLEIDLALTCSYEVMVVDSIDPVINTIATDTIVECDGLGNNQALLDWLASNGGASAGDLCSDVSWNNDFNVFSDSCGSTGSVTVKFTAFDLCGNTATTTATFTIMDNTAPEVNCPDTLFLECGVSLEPGENSDISEWLNLPSGTDICSDVTLDSNSYASEDYSDLCGATGVLNVTFYLSDDCSNVSTCTGVVVIEDNTAPDVNCPDTLFLECGVSLEPGANSDISEWLNLPSGTDICSAVTLDSNSYASEDYSDLCGATGVLNVTFYLSDDCSNVSTCTGVVVIEDNTAPEVNCPDTLFLECGVSLDPGANSDISEWLNVPSGTDICSAVTLDSNSYASEDYSDLCGATGVLNVTFYLSDDCSNVSTCTGVVVIEDNTAPEVNCPDTLFLECGVSLEPGENSDISEWLNLPSGTDICSDVTLDSNSYASEDYSDLCGATGVLNVTFYLSDDCSNVSTCTGVVVIEDNTAPDVNCPDTLFLECGVSLEPGANSDISEWLNLPSGTDICSAVTLDSNSYASEDYSDLCGATGVLNVTFYLSDDCSNVSTCTGVVVIEDNTAPEVNCPDTLFLECGVSLEPGANSDISDWLNLPTGTDICSEVTLDSNSYASEDYSDLCGATGVLNVTFYLSDDCSNVSTCTGVVVIEDNTAPDVNCPDTLFLECGVSLEPGANSDISEWLNLPSGTDICSAVTLDSNSYASEDYSDLCGATGVLNVTFYLSDDCSNVSTCTGVVVIEDNTAPDVNCPDTLFLECGVSLEPGANSDISEWLNLPTGTDICSEVTLDSNSYASEDYSDLCGSTGVLNVTFYLSDDCSNVSTCTGVVVIEDNTAPDVNCPDTLFLECGVSLEPGANSDISDWLNLPSGTDICSAVTLDSNSYASSDYSDLCGATGVLNVTFYLSDDCSNVSTCTGVVVIEDNTAPEVNCPDTLFLECGVSLEPGANSDISEWLNLPSGTDICSAVTLDSNSYASEDYSDLCGATGVLNVTFYLSDDCSNVSTCTGVVVIEDNTAPDVNCPDTLFLECGVSLEPGANSDISEWLNLPSGTDICSAVTLDSNSYASEDYSDLCGATGVLNVTFYLSDDCSNVSTCTGVVVIEDNTAPDVNCPDTLFLECGVSLEPGANSDISEWLNLPSGTDICSDVTLDSNSYASEDYSDLCGSTGVLNVTFYLSDDCSNVSTCTGVVVIEDNTAPDVNCPDTLFLECGVSLEPGANSDISEWLNLPSGTDICSAVTLDSNSYASEDYSDLCGATGVLNVTFYLSDDCSNVSTCTGVVVIEDNTAPEVTCPDTLFLECGVSLEPGANSDISEWLNLPSGTDICSAVTLDSNSYASEDYSDLCGATGVLNVTFYLSDDCSNVSTCTGVVVIEDNTAPDVNCPDTLFLECGVSLEPGANSDISEWLNLPSGTDICSAVTLDSNSYASEDYSDLCGATGVLNVTFYLSDDCSNVSTCTGVVVIEDNTAPDVNCPDTLFLECGVSLEPGANSDISEWLNLPSGTDICSDVTLDSNSYASEDYSDLCGSTGVLNVTFYLSDDCSNVSTCTGVVVIEDNTAPVVECPEEALEIECSESVNPLDNPDLAAWLSSPTGTDICSDVVTLDSNSYTLNGFSDLCGSTGIQEVTFYLSDECGNVSSCMAEVRIVDTRDPKIVCPSDLVLDCGSGNYEQLITAWLGEVSAEDDCGQVTVTNDYDGSSIPDLSCNQSEGLTVTFEAIDACGLTESCEATIYLTDDTPPQITLNSQYVELACDVVAEEHSEGFSAIDACGDVEVATEVTEGFCVFDPKNISSGSANAYSPTNWFKIAVGGLNEEELTAADIKSLSLQFDVNTSSGGNGGKGQMEFWLVNPCNEAIRLIGPYCVNNSGDPNDLGCEQQGLFHPVFEFTDPCRPQWDNNLVVNNTGTPEKFTPYAQVSGDVMLGNLDIWAVEHVTDFTCEEINGDWYLFGKKDNSENASIQFQEVCLMTCPEAYTREIVATDQCNLSASAKQYMVRNDACSDCYDTWYVDVDATGSNTGTSWEDAFNDVQTALYEAVKGDTIWIAEGTYYPTQGDDRTATFNLNGGVHIYGGFAGDETNLSDRDRDTHPTILSGAIGAAGSDDNSYHVLTVPDCVDAGHLSSVFVEYGNADGNGDDAFGGGVISYGDAHFDDVAFRWSIADQGGHAIYNTGIKGRIVLKGCTVYENGPPTDLSVLNANDATIELSDNSTIK